MRCRPVKSGYWASLAAPARRGRTASSYGDENPLAAPGFRGKRPRLLQEIDALADFGARDPRVRQVTASLAASLWTAYRDLCVPTAILVSDIRPLGYVSACRWSSATATAPGKRAPTAWAGARRSGDFIAGGQLRRDGAEEALRQGHWSICRPNRRPAGTFDIVLSAGLGPGVMLHEARRPRAPRAISTRKKTLRLFRGLLGQQVSRRKGRHGGG